MSRHVTAIEINATYYGSQKPASFRKWAADTPDGFVFTLKGSRFTTNRRVLAEAGESIAHFFRQGMTELGDKLGPILWQFAPGKKFDEADFGAFLDLLPDKVEGLPLRHCVEVRNATFADPAFAALLRRHGVAVVFADHATYPPLADVTGRLRLCPIADRLGRHRHRLSAGGAGRLGAAAGRPGPRAGGQGPGLRRRRPSARRQGARRFRLHHPRREGPRAGRRHGADRAARVTAWRPSARSPRRAGAATAHKRTTPTIPAKSRPVSEIDLLNPGQAGKREQTKAREPPGHPRRRPPVFGELGYEMASVRDIIRRTSLSVGAFYNYYRSKEEVYEALSDDGARRFRPILAGRIREGERLRRLRARRHPGLFRLPRRRAGRASGPPRPASGIRTCASRRPRCWPCSTQVQGLFADVLERGPRAQVDLDYLAAGCIAIAREVGDVDAGAPPIDVAAAAEFAVQMILGGLPALPRAKPSRHRMPDLSLQKLALSAVLSLPTPILRVLAGGGVVYPGRPHAGPAAAVSSPTSRGAPQGGAFTPEALRAGDRRRRWRWWRRGPEPGVRHRAADHRQRRTAQSRRAPTARSARIRRRR